MASITKIGSSWRALVRRKGHKALCKTFATKAMAETWARQREAELDRGLIVALPSDLSLAKVIEAYRDLRDRSRPIADTSNEHYMLKRLTEGLGDKRAGMLTPQDLADYCSMRSEEGAGPYTCNMEVSKLGTVMRYASVALRVILPDVAAQARPLLNHLGIIGGGGKRERRTNDDELPRIVSYLAEHHGQRYADAVEIAVRTAMRRGEVCAIKWPDLNVDKRLICIRDRKHPRKKKGNDEWVPLLGGAWDIVSRQPTSADETDERIFPIHPQTLSKYFKKACDELGIPDLHFHDLRHEGTSQLFEQGYEIQQVALVTGHKDWRNLKRYTNLKPEDLHRGPSVRKPKE